jgi:hypothetical protein
MNRSHPATAVLLLPLWLLAAPPLAGQAGAPETVTAAARQHSEHTQSRQAGVRAAMPRLVTDALPTRAPGSRAWVSGGLGWASRGPAGHLAVSYQSGGNLLSARGSGTIAVFGDPLWDLGLVYGRRLVSGGVHASIGAGVGAVGGETRESIHGDPEPLATTLGVPIEVQLSLRPVPILGIGLYGFGNVNREESFAGVTVAIQIGRLW